MYRYMTVIYMSDLKLQIFLIFNRALQIACCPCTYNAVREDTEGASIRSFVPQRASFVLHHAGQACRSPQILREATDGTDALCSGSASNLRVGSSDIVMLHGSAAKRP